MGALCIEVEELLAVRRAAHISRDGVMAARQVLHLETPVRFRLPQPGRDRGEVV